MSNREHLYNLLKEVFILLDAGDRLLFSQFDLTPPRYYALFHIGEEPGLSARKLSDRMLCDKSNVTRIIRGLEDEGLIFKKPHETDGRSQRIFLTEDGEYILSQVQQAHLLYNEARLSCINDITEGNLLANLKMLNQTLSHNLNSDVLDQYKPTADYQVNPSI